MKTLLQKLKLISLGPPEDPNRSGMVLSSSGPESDFKPKHTQPVQSEVKLVEAETTPSGEIRSHKPEGDGWEWKDGYWSRPVKFVKRCGHYHGTECDCDKPEEAKETRRTRRTRTVRSINDPFNERY